MPSLKHVSFIYFLRIIPSRNSFIDRAKFVREAQSGGEVEEEGLGILNNYSTRGRKCTDVVTFFDYRLL